MLKPLPSHPGMVILMHNEDQFMLLVLDLAYVGYVQSKDVQSSAKEIVNLQWHQDLEKGTLLQMYR
jgi:hypothetical protein